jgi:hypothetical protein
MASVTMERRDLIRFRKCVADGQIAYFHEWGNLSDYIPDCGIVTYPVGIVEFDDGTVACIDVENIRFIERYGDQIQRVIRKEEE